MSKQKLSSAWVKLRKIQNLKLNIYSDNRLILIVASEPHLFTQQAGKVGGMYSEVSNVVRYYGGFVDVSRVLC